MDNLFTPESVSLWVVAVSAAATFLSPCILPLIPTYLSVISGVSISDTQNTSEKPTRKNQLLKVMKSTLLFSLGFSSIFIAAGATATLFGMFIIQNKLLLMKIAGILVILLGMSMLDVPFLRFLNIDKRLTIHTKKHTVFFPILFGASFALGWSPCIGPILSTVLVYSASSETVIKGILLLAFFSMILTVLFMIAGILFVYALGIFKSLNRYTGIIKKISAIILIIAGILLLMNKFSF